MAIKSRSIGSAGSAVAMHLITGGTNATPIVATFAANSGLKTGDRVAISGITGLTAMNGEWTLEAVTATTFKLLGSVGNGTYGGTPRCALIMDQTPHMEDHSMFLSTQGNCVGTLLVEAFGSYAEFAAGDNSLGGAVQAPVQTSAQSFITNVNATSASLSTIASSSIVMAATAEGIGYEIKPSKYLRFSLSAWTSGTIAGSILA
jgi:hypothetical protein